MNDSERKQIDGWLEKASNHLDVARHHLDSFRPSDAIQAAQVCVELSVKTVLSLLRIEFPPAHGWDGKLLRGIAEQIEKRKLLSRLQEQHLGHIKLPRLLILVNFWDQFYIQAKYGIEAGHLAPAQDLFERPEAQLACDHASECYCAAKVLRAVVGETLGAVLAK